MTDDETRAELERHIAEMLTKYVGQPLDVVKACIHQLAAIHGESLLEARVVSNDGETLRFHTTVDARWCVGLPAADLRAMGMDVGEAIPGDAVMVIVDGDIGWLRPSVTTL